MLLERVVVPNTLHWLHVKWTGLVYHNARIEVVHTSLPIRVRGRSLLGPTGKLLELDLLRLLRLLIHLGAATASHAHIVGGLHHELVRVLLVVPIDGVGATDTGSLVVVRVEQGVAMAERLELHAELPLHLVRQVVFHAIVVQTGQRGHIVHPNGSGALVDVVLEDGWNEHVVDVRLLLGLSHIVQSLSKHIFLLAVFNRIDCQGSWCFLDNR